MRQTCSKEDLYQPSQFVKEFVRDFVTKLVREFVRDFIKAFVKRTAWEKTESMKR